MKYLIFSLCILVLACQPKAEQAHNLRLWYDQPAANWTEALPVGNGRIGAMVYGGVAQEQIQFNEETLWTGQPHDYAHEGAFDYLDEIRGLILDGKQKEAEDLAMEHFMSDPLRQKAYQPFGDLMISFDGHDKYSDYYRELDLNDAVCRTRYRVGSVQYEREVFASYTDNVLVVNVEADQPGKLNFNLDLASIHKNHNVTAQGSSVVLEVEVSDGGMLGKSKATIKTDGTIKVSGKSIQVTDASEAMILLAAATNFVNYDELSSEVSDRYNADLNAASQKNYNELRASHISDHQALFNRFELDLGTNDRDTLPTDTRLLEYSKTVDPQLVAMYVQYGRYLMIASSRPGTHPANLQGIWNADIKPAWDSKYTVNINTEMNYWPAELTNLSECHEPLFDMIKDCSETGRNVAKVHYNASGWVLHHNTDQWRGTAPINHSNHGIWVSGSGWLSTHLWEHYLFTKDKAFLSDRAYPIMKEAALFYKDILVEDPESGWLISNPSNSPEIGGLVAGPTMDHQIIRALFRACVESSKILAIDQEFAEELEAMIPRIAPNQIGQYGQLQEWLEDRDDPLNKHRHVSHLWGMHPGNEINWEETPELLEAAKQSLIFRGDDGTGWSLAWKINFWARFLDGNHANELIKLLFRPVAERGTRMGGGGSYVNLFDAHPPFQIDGNFGATAGIVEMLVQSHLSSIDLLPALPDAYPEGKLRGVCARGGFELDLDWKDGKLTQVRVVSKAGSTCSIRYKDQKIEFNTQADGEYLLDENLKIIG